MRYWIYCEPVSETCDEAVWQVWSDKAILADYFENWRNRMKKAHKPLSAFLEYDEQRCIADWATTHWAMPATPENLLKIIWAPKGT
jgi:hypothetical protein